MEALATAINCKTPVNKSAQIRKLLAEGDTTKALSLASTFRLGPPALLKRVKTGHDAYQNPRFYLQIKKDPVALVADGVAALQELIAL